MEICLTRVERRSSDEALIGGGACSYQGMSMGIALATHKRCYADSLVTLAKFDASAFGDAYQRNACLFAVVVHP